MAQMDGGPPLLADFLIGAKKALISAIANKRHVMLVIGRDTADIDSVASSILFAYLRTTVPPDNAWSRNYIPLVNSKRADIANNGTLLRTLPQAGLTLDHLICLDDLVPQGSTRSGLTEENTRFFLINHNLLLVHHNLIFGRKDSTFSRNVAGCVDNHVDEQYVPEKTTPEPRIIGRAGSTASLVAYYGRKSWGFLESKQKGEWASQLARLTLAAVLLNTSNLEARDILSEEDVVAAWFLESQIYTMEGGAAFDRKTFYRDILGRKGKARGFGSMDNGSDENSSNYTSSPTDARGGFTTSFYGSAESANGTVGSPKIRTSGGTNGYSGRGTSNEFSGRSPSNVAPGTLHTRELSSGDTRAKYVEMPRMNSVNEKTDSGKAPNHSASASTDVKKPIAVDTRAMNAEYPKAAASNNSPVQRREEIHTDMPALEKQDTASTDSRYGKSDEYFQPLNFNPSMQESRPTTATDATSQSPDEAPIAHNLNGPLHEKKESSLQSTRYEDAAQANKLRIPSTTTGSLPSKTVENHSSGTKINDIQPINAIVTSQPQAYNGERHYSETESPIDPLAALAKESWFKDITRGDITVQPPVMTLTYPENTARTSQPSAQFSQGMQSPSSTYSPLVPSSPQPKEFERGTEPRQERFQHATNGEYAKPNEEESTPNINKPFRKKSSASQTSSANGMRTASLSRSTGQLGTSRPLKSVDDSKAADVTQQGHQRGFTDGESSKLGQQLNRMESPQQVRGADPIEQQRSLQQQRPVEQKNSYDQGPSSRPKSPREIRPITQTEPLIRSISIQQTRGREQTRIVDDSVSVKQEVPPGSMKQLKIRTTQQILPPRTEQKVPMDQKALLEKSPVSQQQKPPMSPPIPTEHSRTNTLQSATTIAASPTIVKSNNFSNMNNNPATTTSTYPTINDILSQDYEQLEASNQTIGITSTTLSLTHLIFLADPSNHNRPPPTSATTTPTPSTLRANTSPFTSAIRKFASSRNLAVYCLSTSYEAPNNAGPRRELFLWVMNFGFLIPIFTLARGLEFGLERWGVEDEGGDEGVGGRVSAGVNGGSGAEEQWWAVKDGISRAFWWRNLDVGRERLGGALVECLAIV